MQLHVPVFLPTVSAAMSFLAACEKDTGISASEISLNAQEGLVYTGVRMNRKKIRQLMKKFGLVCPIRRANPYRRMQKVIRTKNTSENLVILFLN